MPYTEYFNRFPTVPYDLEYKRGKLKKPIEVTNLFFRVRVLKEALNNISSYYVVDIEDGETPEIMADKVYKDPGAAWMITMANNIVDPQWDWPLAYNEFQKYIIGKYGSVEAAMGGIHHYEKVVETTNSLSNVTNVKRYVINLCRYTTQLDTDLKYQYYGPFPEGIGYRSDTTLYKTDTTLFTADLDYDFASGPSDPGSLSDEGYYTVYEFGDATITERVYKNAQTYYEWEQEQNEAKREIKIIKKDYYFQILEELRQITLKGRTEEYRRRLR